MKRNLILLGLVVTGVFATPVAQADSAFGSFTANPGAAGFIGIFYDLKQHPDGTPRDIDYVRTVARFLDSGWDEHALDSCYRASRPLYTTQVLIPVMDASAGPASFGVENRVKPTNWIVHYKAQVQAPKAGTFRFLGMADDVMAAAVNGKTVLIGALGPIPANWKPKSLPTIPSPSGALVNGDWFTVKKDEIIDVDVLIGEIPGGTYDAFCMIEEQGVTYPDNRVPVFQLARVAQDYWTGGTPPHVVNEQVWKGVP